MLDAVVVGDMNVVRCLAMAGVKCTLATWEDRSRTQRSRFCHRTVPLPIAEIDPAGCTAALVRLGESMGTRPALLYQGDGDLLAISRQRDVLAPHFRMLLPDQDLVEDCVDKLRFHALTERLDLPVPRTQVIAPGDDVDGIVAVWDCFPCVVKPAVRTRWFGSRLQRSDGRLQKALRVTSKEELVHLARLMRGHPSTLLLQESVEGGEERILSYHTYVRPGGERVADFTGRKIRTWSRVHGVSTFVEITDDPAVREAGRAVIGRLGFVGVMKLDFKQDERTGRLNLLEANPRFNLWHYPGAVAGVNLPQLVLTDLEEPGTARAGKARPGVRWMALMGDWAALPEYRAAGELDLWGWLRSVLSVDVFHEFSWTDPMPLLRGVARKVGRASGLKLAGDCP